MLHHKITLYVLLCFTVFLHGCSNSGEIIQYEYNGIIITRVNNYPEDYFYYGKFDNTKELPEKYILSKFSGFDGVMSAFLIFKKDKTVEIISVAGFFSKIGDNPFLKLNNDIENIDFTQWRDSTKENMDSIIQVSDVIKVEIDLNKAGDSKVKAKYNESLLQDIK